MVKRYRVANKRFGHKQSNSFSLCLILLCFDDLIILIVACLTEYIEQTFSLYLRDTSIVSCKTISFLFYFFSSFASYLNAFIAVDRWYAVARPILYQQKQIQRAHKQILFILLATVTICMPYFYFAYINPKTNKCEFPNSLENKLTLLDGLTSCFSFLFTLAFSSMTLCLLICKASVINYKCATLHRLLSFKISKTLPFIYLEWSPCGHKK